MLGTIPRLVIEITLPTTTTRDEAEKIIDRLKDSMAIKADMPVALKQENIVSTANWNTQVKP